MTLRLLKVSGRLQATIVEQGLAMRVEARTLFLIFMGCS